MKPGKHTHGGHRGGGLCCALFILLCFGCRDEEPKLVLYCGAGIRPPVEELVEQFRDLHGVTVECYFAGSEELLGRIKTAAEGDLYLPGDVYYVELADRQQMIRSKRNVCYFVPVILVQRGNPKDIQTLADLLRPEIELGLGDPRVCAIGRKSLEVFQKNGFSEEKVLRNTEYHAKTVSHLGTHVQEGSLDATIVWDAMAKYFEAKTVEIPIVPPQQNIISTVAVGVLRYSEQPQMAEEFVDFLTSDRGKAVFRKHRYTTESPP